MRRVVLSLKGSWSMRRGLLPGLYPPICLPGYPPGLYYPIYTPGTQPTPRWSTVYGRGVPGAGRGQPGLRERKEPGREESSPLRREVCKD